MLILKLFNVFISRRFCLFFSEKGNYGNETIAAC